MGLFKPDEVQKKIGIAQSTLSRWVDKGFINHVSRGLYIHPQSSVSPEYLDFAIACSHFGFKSAIGGLSALFYYGLIEQVPQQVWLIVPPARKDESIQRKYKCLRTQTSLINSWFLVKMRAFALGFLSFKAGTNQLLHSVISL